QAQIPLDDVNNILNSEFPVTEDYHTLAGFMIHHLQCIPEEGARLRYNAWELVLVEAEDNRLHTIRVRSLPTDLLQATSDTPLHDAPSHPLPPTDNDPINHTSTPNHSDLRDDMNMPDKIPGHH
ncbi:MAG: hypothetical protein F6K36_30530, partial [Symploca sp. SIO3C6]|nr:hypothetical protein [Symploca sp. SIO3C6]